MLVELEVMKEQSHLMKMVGKRWLGVFGMTRWEGE